MPGIFVSYRRSDSGDQAARIADWLRLAFGRQRVFFDRAPESLAAGDVFGPEIDRRIEACDVVLVVVGHGWLVANPETERPRLFDAGDYVARELRGALGHSKVVMPVLLDEAKLPAVSAVPADVWAVFDCNYAAVRSDSAFDRDVEALIESLRKHVVDDRSRWRRFVDRRRAVLVPAAALTALVVGAVAAVLAVTRPTPPQPRMDGSLNVAIAPLAVTGARDRDGEDVSVSASAAIADAIRASATDGSVLVWGPDRVGPIDKVASGGGKSAALARAAHINADVLIYGIARPSTGARASVELHLVLRGADERRPSDPLVLEQAFAVASDVDIRRLDTADDATNAFPALASFGPVVRSLHLLDRDDTAQAIAVLESARAGVAPSPPVAEELAPVVATIDALLGLAYTRRAEAHDTDALARAADAFERALAVDSDLAFARIGLLGIRYLQLMGLSPSVQSRVDPGKRADLERLRGEYVALRERAVGEGDASVTRAQASNVIGQLDVVLDEASGRAQPERRAAALAAFMDVDAAYRHASASLPELALLANVARADLGYVAAAAGDLMEAIRWYREARDIATPYWSSVQSASIGVIELQLGSYCDAAHDLALALDGRTRDRSHIEGADRDGLAASLAEARRRC